MKSMENRLADEKSLTQKVVTLLQIAKNKICDESTVEQVALLTREHSEDLRLGKVFGYSVSDYAFATLRWLDTNHSINIFDQFFRNLSDDRKNTIEELIKTEAYNQL